MTRGPKNKTAPISLRTLFFQVNFAGCVEHVLQRLRQPRIGCIAFRSFVKYARWAFFLGLLLRPAPASAQGPAAQTPESDSAADQTATQILPLYTGATSSAEAEPEPGTAAIPAAQAAPSATQTEQGASAPDQTWNFHVQNTGVFQGYPSFSA